MKTYLLNIWDTIRTSYWFVPLLIASGAVALALIMPGVDAWIVESKHTLPNWIRTTTDTARTTLSVMTGAMVTVTGTVFSITIVTLSLTSQQFGPRLLRRFMLDLPTQITLGVFLSTGFYCLIILRHVEHHAAQVSVPHLSVLVAVVFTVLSMILLIMFIHHVAMLIQAPHVIAAVAEDLDDAIERLFPEEIGDPRSTDIDDQQESPEQQKVKLESSPHIVASEREGYIQALDGEGLLQIASNQGLVIRLISRPGDFIAKGALLAEVWTNPQEQLPESTLKELTAQLNEALIVGVRRTPRQDIECAIDELVEVAVRSLSPGINDPFTAITCIDYLGASLGRLAHRKLPATCRYDDSGELRFIARPVTFSETMDTAFNQIRQYGGSSVAVVIRLLEALAFIAENVHRQQDGQAVERHVEMCSRLAESITEEHDLQDIQARIKRVKSILRENKVLE